MASSSCKTSKIECMVNSDNIGKQEDGGEQANANLQNTVLARIPNSSIKSDQSYIMVSVLCLLVAFGGFVFGWDTGTISGFINMPDFKHRFGSKDLNGSYYFTNVRMGLIVGIFNIGCALGGIILSKLGDIYGRKIGLMVVMIVYITGIIIQITAASKWYQFLIGRIIAGLGVGGVSVLSPMFISETSPKLIRGALISCYQLMITGGIFLGYCATYGTKSYHDSAQWRIPLGLCFLWAILMIVGMIFMPESPRFLIQKDKVEKARASLAYINRVSIDNYAVFTECEEIKAGIDLEAAAGKATWTELITGSPNIGRRVLTGIVLQSLQQLTGNNFFFYYGTTIFQAIGMDDSFQTSIILGIVNFGSTFVALWAVDHLGRRKVLLIGAAGMVCCYAVFSTVGVTKLYSDGFDGPTSNAAGTVMIVFASLFIFFFATSWAPVTFVVVSEIYPIRIRSKAMAIAQAANWIWGFLIAFFTPFITAAIHFAYGYVFMGCLIFSLFFVYFCVPETKGLKLEDVDELYFSGVMPWKSANWEAKIDEIAHIESEINSRSNLDTENHSFETV